MTDERPVPASDSVGGPARSGARDEEPEDRAPDVFLSYAREDADRAEWAFRVLTSRGWAVWIDRDLPGGGHWRREIDRTLDDVGCVVVLWSSASIASNWVMDEAGEGMERGVLVPALLEDVEIPIGFRQAQAIDLVGARVPPAAAEAALVAGVSNVLGRPGLEPKPSSRTSRLIRRDGPLAAAIVPLVIGLPLLLQPAGSTVIDLDVTATETAFVSATGQDLTDMLVVPSFEADGLASIALPRTRAAAERTVSADAGRSLGLRLSGAAPGATGSITLESIRVPEGTRVDLAVPDASSARISLTASSSPIGLSVDGVLEMSIGAGDTEPIDFTTPKRLDIAPDPLGATFMLRGLEPDRRLVSSPVLAAELSFVRIDRTVETTRTAVTAVSTLMAGTVRVNGTSGREIAIGARERLRLGGVSGEIRELALADGALRVRFLGSAGSIESCATDDDCESWMPSNLQSLVARHLPWLLVVAAMYVVLLAVLTRRRLLAARFSALVLALSASADPATATVRAQDPDEAAKQLVVRVESAIGFGSGILVGTRSDTLFIVTANHVVRRGPAAADSIDVRFYWRQEDPVRATLLPAASDSLDLAVLAVVPSFAVPAIPFGRLGNLALLERGDPIWLLGHPNGLPWRINSSPERFIGFRGASLDFESNLLARGHSGGALLNDDREVIGMLKSDQAPYGEALDAYTVARTLEAWGYPFDLLLPAPQLQAGQGRTCVLTALGDTRCIGYDDRYEPGPLDPGMRLKQLSLRDDHACGIAAGGRAFCLGANGEGQLGDGTTVARYGAPVEVTGGLAFESISAGAGHTCGIVAGGDVYCWGLADAGQLGAAYTDSRSSPVRVPVNVRFRLVSAMWQHTCGLTTRGEAWCWGALAGSAGRRGSPPERAAPDLTFTALSAGWYHICALLESGEAWCWGFNESGQLGGGTAEDEFREEPVRVTGGHAFTAISAGVAHTCALTAGGEAWCWGLNASGQLGNGTSENSAAPVRVAGGHTFETISTGDLHTCGLTPGGEMWCWGNNEMVGSHEGNGVLPGGEAQYLEPVRALALDPGDRRPWRR